MLAWMTRPSTKKTCGQSSTGCSLDRVALERQNPWAGRKRALCLLHFLFVRHRKGKMIKPEPWRDQLLLAMKTSWLLSKKGSGQPVHLHTVYNQFSVATANPCYVQLFSRSARRAVHRIRRRPARPTTEEFKIVNASV